MSNQQEQQQEKRQQEQLAPPSQPILTNGGGGRSSSTSSNNNKQRRSIFSTRERSQAVVPGAARDLTKSAARVRALRLQTSAGAAVEQQQKMARNSLSDDIGSGSVVGGIAISAEDIAAVSAPRPGYTGQRTSKRLSPSSNSKSGVASALASPTASRCTSANYGDGAAPNEEKESPGAWALRHAAELAGTFSEDDLVGSSGTSGGESGGESGSLEQVVMTTEQFHDSVENLDDGGAGGSSGSEGRNGGGGGAAASSSAAAGLPPRPAANSGTNRRESHRGIGGLLLDGRDSSHRSRADSEGGDTVPMSNLFHCTSEDDSAANSAANSATNSASSLNRLDEEGGEGGGDAGIEVEISPGLFGTIAGASIEDDTPKASNVVGPAGGGGGDVGFGQSPSTTIRAQSPTGKGGDGQRGGDGGDYGFVIASPATPITDRAADDGNLRGVDAVDVSGGMSPVSPVTPGDGAPSTLSRYGSIAAGQSSRAAAAAAAAAAAGTGATRRSNSLRSSKISAHAHQIDNVSKLSMDDVLDGTGVGDGGGGPPPQPTLHATKHHLQENDPTLHLQSLLLAVTFLFVWTPQNLMAPNLTQMADFFGFTPEQRDLYLGAYVAFATGVLSLPVSAAIGFVADLVTSRKKLYAMTCLVGGVAAILTGVSRTYAQLYFARFVCGGCMSGSVPIAFSLLGDLFDTKDRNAASAGLTAMMGAGILFGQVYAGCVGSQTEGGWRGPFYLSGALTIVCSLLVLQFVREPVRGGKEKALQDMLATGTKYEKKLTFEDFMHAILRNQSNALLIWFGFFTSIPWGVIFTFLNDYLSQEQGMSVPDATMLVLWFGIGCALGGILGGYLGQLTMNLNASYLPLFMASSTFLGMFPFLLLLNGTFHTASILPCFYSLLGGCVANLPSVNMRPCIINVNAPEVRGASLNASNIAINLARGAGPSCITIMGAIWGVSRQFSFNVTLIVFWTISAIQLVFLAKTLPRDQDAMETELARYAESALGGKDTPSITSEDSWSIAGDESLVSIEERAHYFDARAAEQSLMFLGEAFREVEIVLHRNRRHQSDAHSSASTGGAEVDRTASAASRKSGNHDHRRTLWKKQQIDRKQKYEPINEETELMVEWKAAPIEGKYHDAEAGNSR